MKDPCGIAGANHAADTEPQRQQLVKAAEYAHRHANAPVNAEARRDFGEANRHWSLVFNDQY